MSDSTKKIVGLIGLVAIGIATFGVGAAVLGAGITTSLGTALGSTAILGLTNFQLLAIGATLLSAAATPSLESTGANVRGIPVADSSVQAAYVFGTTVVPCAVIYEEMHGNEPDRGITNVFAHCWHRIESYQSLYVTASKGRELVTFTGEVGNGNYTDLIWWFHADGTQTQSLQDTHTAPQMNNNAWPSTAILKGCAHSAIYWNIDDNGFISRWSSVPTRIDIIVEGAWLYDPRLDPTYGTGTQDFGTPSSWAFNNGNAALVLLRFLIGEYDDSSNLVWGRGIAESDVDMDSFIAAANVADETLDSKPRFRLGGAWQLDGNFESFVRQWEQETGGKLSKIGGIYYCWLPNNDLTAITTITEAQFLQGVSVGHTMGGDISSFYNMARGRYIEAAEGYQGFPYPDVREETQITDEGERVLSQDFSWVQDVSIAQRIARIKVRRSRFQRIWTFALGWPGQGPNFKPFTVHNLNCKETNDTNQLVRVIDRKMGFNGVTVITVQEESAQIYDDTPLLGTSLDSNSPPGDADPSVVPRTIQGIGLLINANADGTTDTGESSIYALRSYGPDWTTDGFITWKDQTIFVPRDPGDGQTYAGGGIGARRALLLFDTAKPGTPRFTSNGQARHTVYAYKEGGVWYYDNNASAVSFTPIQDRDVALGWVEMNGDLVVEGGLFGSPMPLEIAAAVSEPGNSSIVVSVYQRAASPPATPTADDGEYNFGTQTLTPPTGWSTTPPAADGNPLYVSTGIFEITGTTGTDSTVTWTATALLVSDGADGAPGSDGTDGNTSFLGQVYQRSATQPSTPAVDDGSYNFDTQTLTPPSGWSTTPPAGTLPLWVSLGIFEISGTSGTDNTVTWTTPARLVSDGPPGDIIAGAAIRDWESLPTGGGGYGSYLSIYADFANSRLYVRPGVFSGGAGTTTFALEVEIYGTTVSSFTDVNSEATWTDQAGALDFSTFSIGASVGHYGTNGIKWREACTVNTNDEVYMTLASLTSDTQVRIKIRQWDQADGGLSLGNEWILQLSELDTLNTSASEPEYTQLYFKPTQGVIMTWKGSLASAPANPQVNWAYYNTTDGQAYIWDGDSWETLAIDGTDGLAGADGADGADGIDSRTVNLTATQLAFNYLTDNTLDSAEPANITITATALNTVGTPFYEFFVDDVSQQNTSSNTYTYTPEAAYGDMPNKIEVNLREGSGVGTIYARDQITIIGIKPGSDAVQIVQTNEAHTIPVTNLGVHDYTGSGNTLEAYIGNSKLLYDNSAPYANGSFRVTSAVGTNITVGTGTPAADSITYGNASAMTAETAYITFTITVVNNEGIETTGIVRIQSFARSNQGADGADGVAGADGADGADGVDSRTVNLTAGQQAFKYLTDDTLDPGENANTTVTATALNTVGTPWYEFFVDDVSQQNSVTPTYTYTPKADYADMPDKIEVNLREGGAAGTIYARDQFTIVGIKPGTDAAQVVQSNEAHTIPVTNLGVHDYTGSGNKIEVYLGSTKLAYDNTPAYANGSFRVTSAVGTNITVGTPTENANDITYGVASAMTADTAYITYTIVIKNNEGLESTITRQQSFARSVQGDDGATGATGATGADGIDALGGATLNKDPFFENTDKYWFSNTTQSAALSSTAFAVVTSNNAREGTTFLRHADAALHPAFSERFPISPNKTYLFEFGPHQSGTTERNHVGIIFYDGDGNTIGTTSSPASDALGWTSIGSATHYVRYVTGQFPTTTPNVIQRFAFGKGGEASIPSNATAAAILWYANVGSLGSGNIYMNFMRVRELDESLTELPASFGSGSVGGFDDFTYFMNRNEAGADAGEILVVGTRLDHPDQTRRTKTKSRDAIFTPFDSRPSRFFLMWTDTAPWTRWGGTENTDWGDANIVPIYWEDEVGGWFAVRNGGTRHYFTPGSTDCIIAAGVALGTTGVSAILKMTGQIQNPETKQLGIIFKETFENYLDSDDLLRTYDEVDDGSPGTGTITFPANGLFGGAVLRVAGNERWLYTKEIIPFDPRALYKFTLRLRVVTDVSVSANSYQIIGFRGLAADGVTHVNRTGGTAEGNDHYVAYGGLPELVASDGWIEHSIYVQGTDASAGENYAFSARTPLKPLLVHENVRYFQPSILLNYNNADATVELDYYIIEKIDFQPVSELVYDPFFSTAFNSGKGWESYTEAGAPVANYDDATINSSGGQYGGALELDIPASSGHRNCALNSNKFEVVNNDVLKFRIRGERVGTDTATNTNGNLYFSVGVKVYNLDGTLEATRTETYQNVSGGIDRLMPNASTWYDFEIELDLTTLSPTTDRMYAQIYTELWNSTETGTYGAGGIVIDSLMALRIGNREIYSGFIDASSLSSSKMPIGWSVSYSSGDYTITHNLAAGSPAANKMHVVATIAGAGFYRIFVKSQATNSFVIRTETTGGAATNTPDFHFVARFHRLQT